MPWVITPPIPETGCKSTQHYPPALTAHHCPGTYVWECPGCEERTEITLGAVEQPCTIVGSSPTRAAFGTAVVEPWLDDRIFG